MKKKSKIFSAIIIALVIVGLTMPLLNIFAQENLQAPLKEVSNKVEELIELKDDNTLSDQEKEQKEIQVRKEALEKILDLSLIETKNLTDKLNSLELSSDDQIAIKEKFIEILSNNTQFSTDLKSKINQDSINLEGIKAMAQEYKDWREVNYNPYIKKITVFILTFQEKQVLKTANTRLDKIMSDIKKLEDLKIIKKDDTLKFITNSTKNLSDAQILNNDAETKIVSIIKKEIIEAASTTPETVMAVSSLTIQSTPSPEIATSTIKTISDEESAQSLVENSLQEIKNAYTNFINISVLVSQKLKIK